MNNLLQQAKDEVAKRHLQYSDSVWDDVLSPDKLKLIDEVAIKYKELCDEWTYSKRINQPTKL
jgi:hypothetical protein